MKEFLKLVRNYREYPIEDDGFKSLRDQFDRNLAYFEESLPKIVCLCGSTKFFKAFEEANYRETMAGNIVLTVGFYMHSAEIVHSEHLRCTAEEKIKLDELHKRKIDLCDEILVLNVNGYIGESTRSEVLYALSLKKEVRFLEPDKAKVTEIRL